MQDVSLDNNDTSLTSPHTESNTTTSTDQVTIHINNDSNQIQKPKTTVQLRTLTG